MRLPPGNFVVIRGEGGRCGVCGGGRHSRTLVVSAVAVGGVVAAAVAAGLVVAGFTGLAIAAPAVAVDGGAVVGLVAGLRGTRVGACGLL